MRLATWNLARGGVAERIQLLAQIAVPDIMFLQEAREPTWGCDAIGSAVDGYDWGSWLLTRTGQVTEIAIPEYSGWVSGGRVENAGESLYAFSVHSPTATDSAPRESYIAESAKIVRAILSRVPEDAPLVVAGDFNFKSLGERQLTEAVPTERQERDVLNEWDGRHLAVAWTTTHPNAPLQQTLRWKNNPSTPYHCDGFLVRGLSVVDCTIHDSAAVAALSDHNQVSCVLAPVRAV